MVLATAAVEDRELRHLGIEKAFIRVGVDAESYFELPEEYLGVPLALGSLNKEVCCRLQEAVAVP